MRITWRRVNAYAYIGSNGASREYQISIVGGNGSFRGSANCVETGRKVAVGGSFSSMPGAVVAVLNSLKRMCRDFEDGANCTDEIAEDAAQLLGV